MLYHGIEKSYLSQMEIIKAIIALASGEEVGVKRHGLLATEEILSGVEALKRIKILGAAMANGMKISEKCRIKEGSVND
jgi:hypothetical protein